ncbi:MAG: hypothetical protein ACRBB3_00305 [Alphaproteobacteria bacterium]
MAETNAANAGKPSGSNNESDMALIAFKQLVNDRLPEISKETAAWKDDDGHLISESSNPLDGGYLYILNNFILNQSKIDRTPELKELVDQYNELPSEIRFPADIKRTFFEKPTPSITANNQAQAVINLAQDYLNIEETNDGKIDEDTGRALRKQLEQLQRQNPDIEIEFSPQNNDNRTVDFLNALVQKRMGSAGTDQRDLNQTLIHLWAMEKDAETLPGHIKTDLGATTALLNVMELMVNGNLPTGMSVTPPSADAPWDQDWTNDSAPDTFFSEQTYAALASTTSRNSLGTVHTATLFADIPSNPNGELLKQMAEDIGLDVNKRIFTEIEVGQIAAEMMVYQAKQLCIEEGDINRAIHSGKFMPNLTDLLMVDRGFGFPEGHNTGTAVWEHKSESFGKRFGTIDQDFIDSLGADDRLHGLRFSEELHQSPSSYFTIYKGSMGARGNDLTAYEHKRETEYLPGLADFFADGSVCNAAPKNDNDGGCTVEGVLGDGPCDNKDAAPADDACTVESIIGKNDCSKAFDNSAASDVSIDEQIISNAKSATGNDPECFVEDTIQQDCANTAENNISANNAP